MATSWGKEKFQVLSCGGGGVMKVFSSLDRNLNAYFISKFIEIPSNNLFYVKQNYRVSNTRYQIF